MKVNIKTAVEVVNICIGKKGEMYVTGTKSRMKRTIWDKVTQLAELNHLENVGVVMSGDIDAMRRGIKQECPSLSSIERESSIVYNDLEIEE